MTKCIKKKQFYVTSNEHIVMTNHKLKSNNMYQMDFYFLILLKLC